MCLFTEMKGIHVDVFCSIMITFFFQFALLRHKSSSHVNFGDLPHLVAEACMIGKWAVRILMECFLVYMNVYDVRICDFLT